MLSAWVYLRLKQVTARIPDSKALCAAALWMVEGFISYSQPESQGLLAGFKHHVFPSPPTWEDAVVASDI